MGELDEDLVVDLSVPEGDEKPEPVPGPGGKTEAKVEGRVEPQVGLRDLEQRLEAGRRENERLQEQARRLAGERDNAVAYAHEAERRSGTNYEAWVEGQINGMAAEMENLSAQAEAAMNDGDFKAAAKLNQQMGRLGGQLAIREREKEALAQQRQQQPQRRQQQQQPRQQQQQPRQQPSDPIERAIQGRTAATQQFLRKHPDLIRGDGTLKGYAIRAHEQALDEGHAVDSEAYFRRIEQIIPNGGGGGERGEVKIPGYSAPVARGPGPGSDNLSPGTFRMTPKMRRLADEQGVSPQEWATNYVRLLKEGRITPIT